MEEKEVSLRASEWSSVGAVAIESLRLRRRGEGAAEAAVARREELVPAGALTTGAAGEGVVAIVERAAVEAPSEA